MGSAAGYVAGEVRRFDYDRYIAGLFAPGPRRRALWAFYGFVLEVGRIRHRVSEPHVGAIRFQWWREALDGVERRSVVRHNHPVLDELAYGLTSQWLEIRDLQEVLQLWQQDFDTSLADDGFFREKEACLGCMAALEFKVAARILGSSVEDDLFWRSVGLAWGLTRELRDQREHSDVKGGNAEDMIANARHALGGVRAALESIPTSLMPSLLPLSLVEPWLVRLEKGLEGAPWKPLSPLNRLWRILWAALRGRF
ncbi:MAG: squalene/phytoene synthase family protein [Parvularculales bacterium]